MSLLRDHLKAETADSHERLETLPFFRALHAGQLPKIAIVSLLRSLSIVHGALERTLSGGSISGAWSGHLAGLHVLVVPKVPRLSADLESVGGEGLPSVTPAIRSAIEYAAEILAYADTPLDLVGALYVLEGSQNGGIVLKRAYARCLSIPEDRLSYFGSYGADTASHWRKFCELLNVLPLDEDQVKRVSRSAMHCFERLACICAALFPHDSRGLSHQATDINFEAGAHAIPQNPPEILLALRAGRAAWEQYPYLEQRYGERGRRFTSSDSCWLVALTRLPAESVTKNLEWLRTVLAGRGIPTVILEAHLAAICLAFAEDHLEQAHPGACFEPFLVRRAGERRALRAQQDIVELIDLFDRRLGACTGPTVDSAARLIASAWFDERSGIVGALAAVQGWFVDAGRFPVQWIAMVNELVTRLDQAA
jgi:heme oxygenase